jgi:hypothetical protein
MNSRSASGLFQGVNSAKPPRCRFDLALPFHRPDARRGAQGSIPVFAGRVDVNIFGAKRGFRAEELRDLVVEKIIGHVVTPVTGLGISPGGFQICRSFMAELCNAGRSG